MDYVVWTGYKRFKQRLLTPPRRSLPDWGELLHPHATDPGFRPHAAPALTRQETDPDGEFAPSAYVLRWNRRRRIDAAVNELFCWPGHRQRTDEADPASRAAAITGGGCDPLIWRAVAVAAELMLDRLQCLLGECVIAAAAVPAHPSQRPPTPEQQQRVYERDTAIFGHIREALDFFWRWCNEADPVRTVWPAVEAAYNDHLAGGLLGVQHNSVATVAAESPTRTQAVAEYPTLVRAVAAPCCGILYWLLLHRSEWRHEESRRSGFGRPRWSAKLALEEMAVGWDQTFGGYQVEPPEWVLFLNEVARRTRARMAVDFRRGHMLIG